MATLADRIYRVSDLNKRQSEHLRTLCGSWQVLADLSFSDLLLYVRVMGQELFEISAQLRPFTSQTLYPQDMVGVRVTQPEQPIVERAFREGRVWQQDDPVLVDGIPIRMDAVPVRFGSGVIAVVTKEGSPATSRRPGRLEQVYLQCAERVSQMICDGTFPHENVSVTNEWPRVSDGLFVLDESGLISWASPNALSSIHLLGVKQNVLGRYLDELGLGSTPVGEALTTRRMLDGELVRGDSHIRLRVLPLIERGVNTGALVLARDVSELRQKERMISVKDATIREIHHRVKNNLQTIASLLRLQGRRVSSEEAKLVLQESVMRVGSIALVHETLSEQPHDVAEFGDVANRICRMVSDGLVSPDAQIEIKMSGRTGPLGADLATPLAVSVTELLQNSIEHAFPEARAGTIGVELAREDSEIVVTVWDDGVGLTDAPAKSTRLGLQIVRSLIAELHGSFSQATNGGTRSEIRIPLERRRRPELSPQ
ncbi:MAG: sensor histidine kinase [Actinomycetota bacterium]